MASDVSDDEGLYALLAVGLILLWMASLGVLSRYETRWLGVGTDEFRRLVVASFAVFGALAILSYMFKLDDPPRVRRDRAPRGAGAAGRGAVRRPKVDPAVARERTLCSTAC